MSKPQPVASKKSSNSKVPFPKKLAGWGTIALITITTLIIGWIIFLYVREGLWVEPVWLLFALFALAVIIAVLLYKQRYLRVFQKLQQRFPNLTGQKLLKAGLIIAVILGVGLRLAFLVGSDRYGPGPQLGDTGIHWYTSAELANSEEMNTYEGVYEAFYPHLMSYTAILALFMKIFGANVAAIIFSNLIFDLVATLALYILLKRWRGRKTAQIGAIIWLLNPLEILYCSVSIAIVVTNMMLIIALLFAFLLWQNFQQRRWQGIILWSLLLGLVIALGNSLRPIFTVLAIALVLFWFYQALCNGKKSILPALASLFLLLLVNFGCSQAIQAGYHAMNPYYQGDVGVGWNFFVGANYDSWGRWNAEDYSWWRNAIYGESSKDFREFQPETFHYLEPTDDLAGLQQELFQKGLDRYKNMSVFTMFNHLLHKTVLLFAERDATITWPVCESYRFECSNTKYQAVHSSGIILLVFCIIITFIVFSRLIFRNYFAKIDPFILYLSLCFCGLVAVSLLVEVMRRYLMPISIFFVIFAAYELGICYRKIQNRKSQTHNQLASETSALASEQSAKK